MSVADLGGAYMGLQLLEREKTVFKGEQDAQPDFSGKEYLLERQLKPEARKDIIEKLSAANHCSNFYDGYLRWVIFRIATHLYSK